MGCLLACLITVRDDLINTVISVHSSIFITVFSEYLHYWTLFIGKLAIDAFLSLRSFAAHFSRNLVTIFLKLLIKLGTRYPKKKSMFLILQENLSP